MFGQGTDGRGRGLRRAAKPQSSVARLWLIDYTGSSAVADKPARRAASRQTSKSKNSHVTITTPLLWAICHPVDRIHIAYLCTKFQEFKFSRSSDMIGAPKIFK